MAVRASIATGNFLTAGTWGTVDATSYNNSEATTTALTTTYATSSTFTPGAITISHIGVKLSVRNGTTGTISVCLDLATVDVAGTTVTINTADLPVAATADLNGGWVFFKLAAPVLLLAATAYGVKAKTSSINQVSLFSTATTNWSRALITTTTGAPAAGDDLIVAGEYTGAGTSNSFTVTMNETATTDYGSTPTAANSLIGPGLAICSKGTLTWGTTAATNYNLKMSNSIVVYSGGTYNQGTTGTPCPRDSTMTLLFDCGANVDYGLTVRNLGTCVMQGQSRTSAKLIYYCKLNTDEAIASTSLGVNTDTGWLDNDEIVVASTTQTGSQTEVGALNGAAGASTLTVDGFAGAGGGLAFAHSGTSPTQAEVVLLTRNVKVNGASATLQAYIDIKATASVDCDWVEFKWLGSATTNKRGIDIATTSSGAFTMNYCCLRNFTVTSSKGLTVTGSATSGWVFSNNVTYNINDQHFSVNSTSGTWTADSNLFLLNVGSGVAIASLSDIGGTFTNNTCVSPVGTGITIAEAATIGTISGNTVHSGGSGVSFGSGLSGGTLLDTTLWRNGAGGMIFNTSPIVISNVLIKNLTVFGNLTANINISTSSLFNVTFDNIISNGDTTFATTSGILCSGSSLTTDLNILNSDFSTASGIKVAHTNDINFSTTSSARIRIINTKLGGTNEVTGQSSLTDSSYVSSQKNDQTAGSHKIFKKYGTIQRETTTVHTGSQAMKLTPNNASNKLTTEGVFGGFKCAVGSGATVTPTIYVYEDASYNGNRARLIVKRNDALGITADTVLDTATAASDAAWEALTGTTAAVTDDGTLEFIIDCDGTAGNLFVDSATVA